MIDEVDVREKKMIIEVRQFRNRFTKTMKRWKQWRKIWEENPASENNLKGYNYRKSFIKKSEYELLILNAKKIFE